MSGYQHFGRRATDLLDIESRAWRPMAVHTPSEVRGGGDVLGRHLSRIDELGRRVADLERDNRELAAFAADVAHDMRAPLQAVAGFAELLIRREGGRLDETSQGFVGQILTAAGAMRDLVEAVLQHRQSSYGALTPAWVNTKDLVAAVVRQLRGDLDDAIEVGALPTVFADRVQLGRVFQNLIGNATHAAHPERPLWISVTARRLGTAWEFAVIDNGIGVLADDHNRIFEMFQRGSSEGPHTGHGLGLAICRTIVERHGGRIGVEKAAGGGARFLFTIPDRSVDLRRGDETVARP